ncbi:MAG: beta-1,3-glucanase family protein, partial [Candidatus Baltobacteraceae bacterium]
ITPSTGKPSTPPSSSPSAAPVPTPTGVAGTFPATIVDNDPSIPPSGIHLYIYGENPTTSAFVGVNANGSIYALAHGSTVAAIPWSGTGKTNTVFLPPLIGGRVYIVGGSSLSSIFMVSGATGTGPAAPAPWNMDGSQSVYFDDIEYAETSASNVNFDLSQTDAIGLDLQVAATGSQGTQTIGLKSGAITAFAAALKNGAGAPWSALANEMPYHIINPQHGSPNFFPNATSLDSAIATAWNAYRGGNWMEITPASLSATGYSGPLYGTVDGSGNLNFYAAQSTAGTLVGTLQNPSAYAAAHAETVTSQTLAQNGAFNNFTTPSAVYPTLGPAIGNRVSGALNSGVFVPSPLPPTQPVSTQPICTGRFASGGSAYQNQYAATLHGIANTYAYVAGAAYGYPYDDLCGTSTDTTSNGITSMTITINPS